ncbi:hypothetical protein M8818_007891 [Zalaria obscura]|uniref:Uncharacterized protein n=1 Tax=Zalaria obscura TaxID=2024903 RepID=A0ACC3S2U4_9PEZI
MSDSERVRLHITPFNPTIVDKIIPPSLRPVASDISYHATQTSSEKGFGYVELPKTDADKLKNKLNGTTLKGSKMRIEEARPQKRKQETEEVMEEASETPRKKVKKFRKEKRKDGVLPGHELDPERHVKRGWTEPGAQMKRHEKGEKSKDKKEKRVSSKYTREPEVLFKTDLRPRHAPKDTAPVSASPDKKAKKKKVATGPTVIHEFEKATKFPTFLKQETTSKSVATEFVEGKGWVDEEGNLIEAVRPRPGPPAVVAPVKVAASTPESEESTPRPVVNNKAVFEPASVEQKYPGQQAQIPTVEDGDASDASSSVVSTSDGESSEEESSDEASEDESDAESEASEDVTGGAPQEEALPVEASSKDASEQSSSEDSSENESESSADSESSSDSTESSLEESDDESASEPSVGDDVDMTAPEGAKATQSNDGLTMPATNGTDEATEPKEVHPLEALFKRPKPDPNGTPKPLTINTSFSFFGGEGDADADDEQDLVAPQTPYNQHDLRQRGMRSAAPTPDTAAIGRKFSFPFARGDEDEYYEEEDQYMDDADYGGYGAVATPSKPSEPEPQQESDFAKWFWEHRGDNNRAWKRRRREVLKQKRQRENKRLSRRIV